MTKTRLCIDFDSYESMQRWVDNVKGDYLPYEVTLCPLNQKESPERSTFLLNFDSTQNNEKKP